MAVRVVNIRNETCHVYCGRAGKGEDGYWGNWVGKHLGRLEAIEAYREWFDERVEANVEFRRRLQELKELEKRLAKCGEELKLGCFCAPLPCHADVIKEYLDRMEAS
jgi:hypothetical protein